MFEGSKIGNETLTTPKITIIAYSKSGSILKA